MTNDIQKHEVNKWYHSWWSTEFATSAPDWDKAKSIWNIQHCNVRRRALIKSILQAYYIEAPCLYVCTKFAVFSWIPSCTKKPKWIIQKKLWWIDLAWQNNSHYTMENVETTPGHRMSTICTSIAGDYKPDQVITRLQLEIRHGKLTNESTIIFYSIRTQSSLGNTQLRTNLRTNKK